jgi:hypothetical protein
MRLLKRPIKPESLPLFAPVLRIDRPEPEWAAWLKPEQVQTA